MFRNNRKTIGVFIACINGEYQTRMIHGIKKRAKELDFNLAVYSCYGGYGQDKYDEGEKAILDLPAYENLDGIILALDTFPIKNIIPMIKEKIAKCAHCPVVSIRQYEEAYENIVADNDTILEDVLEHFITKHQFTRINFITGRMNYLDAKQRLNTYKRVLERHNIKYDETRVFYGDYWKVKPRKAVRVFFDGVKREDWPQAIVCSNDYMAVAVTDELEKNGLKVPEDVCISGCDNIDEAINNIPSITTVEINIELMGEMAVNKIYKHTVGEAQNKDENSPVRNHYRESCGCMTTYDEAKTRRKNINDMSQFLENVLGISYMTTDMARAMNRECIKDLLKVYVKNLTGFEEFYLCLNHDWMDEDSTLKRNISSYSDKLTLEVGMIGKELISEKSFQRSDVLPNVACKDKPLCFFFFPLHYQNRNFGYTATSYQGEQSITNVFQSWLINIENMLENVRIYSERNRLLIRLENMYIRDELTGLYNRRGLKQLWITHVEKCKKEKMHIMVVCADLDDLKIINDSYGHASGDIAIKRISEAMILASKHDEIIARCGGDEFTIVGMVHSETEMEFYMDDIKMELDKLNANADTEFGVSVSIGGYVCEPVDELSLEDCMNASDARMYEQKYRKKAFRYRILGQ